MFDKAFRVGAPGGWPVTEGMGCAVMDVTLGVGYKRRNGRAGGTDRVEMKGTGAFGMI